MSKNKKKKMKKKEKMKQKMLKLTQQQIQVDRETPLLLQHLSAFQDAEKQKQNLLSSPDQVNLNKLMITEEKKVNGHEQNSADESDEEIPVIEAANGHGKKNGPVSEGATADLPADLDKLPDLAESDATNRRR